ncbi:MAG: dephospho-CoA kinase [Phototrophicales bacterium]|nr:MAG: dephospho-CoA kinase [Phototrophicales bacterium]
MGHWKDKYVIGITGNIATGKSLVRKMLEHLGASTIDADGLAHQVMLPGAPAYRPVIEWFGKWIVDKDGRIDRNRLGAVVFSHPLALQRLEALTHPIISKGIDTLITRAKQKVVVVEAIKLLEGPLAKQVDAIWVVDAPPEVQLKRLMEKRKMSEAEARKRIAAQNPQAEKIKVAHVVINNGGNPNDTFAQVQAEWKKIFETQKAPEQPAEPETTVVKVSPTTPKSTQEIKIDELKIRRPRPTDFEDIARILNEARGTKLTKEDVMMSFSETSYLIAEANNQTVGVISFVVENLITQSSEIAVIPNAPKAPIVSNLIRQMEAAADSLQSEVAFIYLYENKDDEYISLLQSESGYEILERVEDIKFPAWREALRSRPENTKILYKKLREDRILTPF